MTGFFFPVRSKSLHPVVSKASWSPGLGVPLLDLRHQQDIFCKDGHQSYSNPSLRLGNSLSPSSSLSSHSPPLPSPLSFLSLFLPSLLFLYLSVPLSSFSSLFPLLPPFPEAPLRAAISPTLFRDSFLKATMETPLWGGAEHLGRSGILSYHANQALSGILSYHANRQPQFPQLPSRHSPDLPGNLGRTGSRALQILQPRNVRRALYITHPCVYLQPPHIFPCH